MQWLNVFVPKLRRDPFATATDQELGCWLRLMSYSVMHETRGRIIGAMKWNERKWLLTIGNDTPITTECSLWKFEGDDMHLVDYPDYHQRRKDAKESAKERLRKHRSLKRQRNGADNTHETPVKRDALLK